MEDLFKQINGSIGVTDIIDIIIVAFIIYKLLQFIRETRAEQLAKGVVVFVLITVSAKLCHLYTLHWILSSLMTVGILALIIIFQPELRRALAYLGRGKISSIGNMSGEDTKDFIEDMVKAIDEMSKYRTGALIVIERETALMDLLKSKGTVIDARISDQLIGNIFYEGAPLHDGAVIIRESRLYAAGCVLPLTEDQKLAKTLGTRHRAGIGISEDSDAFVIIVSEETGTISVAEDGKLTRGYDKESLRAALKEIYMSDNQEKGLGKFLSMKNGFFTFDKQKPGKHASKSNDRKEKSEEGGAESGTGE